MYGTAQTLNRRIMDFPDPFISFSNLIYPNTVEDVFRWADRLWTRNGVYTHAIKKSVRYFLNDIELSGDDISYETRNKYQDFLNHQLNILDTLGAVGDDVIAYGNSFTSVSEPIIRSLVCPVCGLSRVLDKLVLDKDYKWVDFKFKGDCPKCRNKNLVFERLEATANNADQKLNVIRWAPQHVRIKHCPITGESDYEYDIPPEMKRDITQGSEVYLRSIPWALVEAVQQDKPFKFNRNTFKHLKCDTSASMLPKMQGWGLPLFMSNFSQVVHLQILERFNEAIAMDYIIPFRVITPPSGGGKGQDPMLLHNMGNFMGAVRRMIKQHRQDPTTWHTLPFPLQYQAVGGEAKSLVPVELLDRALDNLLTSMGIPQEFYRETLSSGGPPISLRLFEKTWKHNTRLLNDWLNWFLSQISRVLGWEAGIHGKLAVTSIIEDEQTKQIKLQLASSKVISNRTALSAFGIDMDYERRQVVEEDRAMNDMLREQQAKDQQIQMFSEVMAPQPPGQPVGPGGAPPAAAAGAPPPPAGGMPPMGGAGGGNPSLDELMAQANDLAQQIMTMDPTSRRNALSELKNSNPALHAQVKQIINDTEQGIKSDALAQAKMQAMQGGGQPM